MNILSINAVSAQPAFTAKRGEKKVRGQKPSSIENLLIQRDHFYNTSNDSPEKIMLKIKYLEKRLASEERYLEKELKSHEEKRYVDMTIMRLKNELNTLREALTKALAKRI